jgi:hypothetical protein
MLPASLLSLLIAKYEDEILKKQIPMMSFYMFDLDYCCVRGSNPYDPITSGYFKALYDEHIKSHVYTVEYCEKSGYGIDLYAPYSIKFKTNTNDVYCISYRAYTSNNDCDTNWNRKIAIYKITYWRNNEPSKELKFMFVNGGGCGGLVEYNGKAKPYNMSYIALDNDMNYMGHYFKGCLFENNKHKKMLTMRTKQLTDLINKNKTSKLPFFVNFLESIADPIMRLIYLFTYMPSVRVVSGK